MAPPLYPVSSKARERPHLDAHALVGAARILEDVKTELELTVVAKAACCDGVWDLKAIQVMIQVIQLSQPTRSLAEPQL